MKIQNPNEINTTLATLPVAQEYELHEKERIKGKKQWLITMRLLKNKGAA